MSLCHQEMIENLMHARVDESFTIARDVLSNNKHVRDTFEIVHKDQEFSPSMEDKIDRIYKLLVVKTLREKFGSELKWFVNILLVITLRNLVRDYLEKKFSMITRGKLKMLVLC